MNIQKAKSGKKEASGEIKEKLPKYFLILLLIIFSTSLAINIGKIKKFNKTISEKEEKIAKIKKENEEIKKKLEEAKSQEYIEKQLRDSLGLAKEGEIVVVLPDEDTLRNLAPKLEKEESTLPDPNWKRWLKLFM